MSRIGSTLPHCPNSHHTNSVKLLFVHSRTHASGDASHTLERDTQCLGQSSEPSLHPSGDSRALGPPGRGGIRVISTREIGCVFSVVRFFIFPVRYVQAGPAVKRTSSQHSTTSQLSRISPILSICCELQTQLVMHAPPLKNSVPNNM